MTQSAFIGFDTAYSCGVVCVFTRDTVLFELSLDQKWSHGKGLIAALKQSLHFCKQQNYAVTALFSGIGPGSFVGIRISLATALGFTLAAEIPLLGFCSHRALSHSLENEKAHAQFFMKASGELGYVSRYSEQDAARSNSNKVSLVTAKDFEQSVNESYCVFSDVPQLLSLYQKSKSVRPILGPSGFGVMRAALDKLALSGLRDESVTLRPNYIKAPNVSLSTVNRH